MSPHSACGSGCDHGGYGCGGCGGVGGGKAFFSLVIALESESYLFRHKTISNCNCKLENHNGSVITENIFPCYYLS